VHPFAGIVNKTKPKVPRLLINLEKVGELDPIMRLFGIQSGFEFNKKGGADVFHKSTCDEGCQELARLLGWEEELLSLKEKVNKELEEKWTLQKTKLEIKE